MVSALARPDRARSLCLVATRKKQPKTKTGASARAPRRATPRGKAALLGASVAAAASLALGLAVALHPGTEAVAERVEVRADGLERLATTVPATLDFEVVARHPHDPDAFTQGLLFHDGRLFESTGLEGRSTLREVELTTGRVLRQVELSPREFGEGLARVDDRLVQITWQNQIAHVWDLESFERLAQHRYSGEGWGLCYDGNSLVMSDGTSALSFRDPNTFDVRRSVRVTKLGRPVRLLNELECVDGVVFANVWQTDEILRIDPSSGRVTGVLRAGGLLSPAERQGTDVLNGIAYVPETGRFLITGKLWPAIFEIAIRER
jgi:glutaminyl-peptide cyclotransferase